MSKEQLQTSTKQLGNPEVKWLNRALGLYIKGELDSLDSSLLTVDEPTKTGSVEKISIDFIVPDMPILKSIYLRSFPKDVSSWRYPGPEDDYAIGMEFTQDFRDSSLFGIDWAGRSTEPNNLEWSQFGGLAYWFTLTGNAKRFYTPLDPSDYELIDTALLELNRAYPNVFRNFREFEQIYYSGGKRAALRKIRKK